MKEVFSISRFGKYLLTDIKTGINSFGISLLSFGLVGLAFNIISLLFELIFSSGYTAIDAPFREGLFLGTGAIACIMIPVKYYGRITDKRKGADFLLSPASTLEKFLSMIIMTLILIPGAYSVIFIGTDLVWSLFDRTYDMSLLSSLRHSGSLINIISVENVSLSDPFISAMDDCAYGILTFLLGGLCFKKSKIGKTFLVITGVGVALAIILGLIFINNIETPEALVMLDFERLMTIDTIIDLTILSGLLAAIYFRLRKIQL